MEDRDIKTLHDKRNCKDCKSYSKKDKWCRIKKQYVARKNYCEEWEKKK